MNEIILLITILIAGDVSYSARIVIGNPSEAQIAERRPASENVIGEVASINKDARILAVRTDQGATIEVKAGDETACLKVPAGETTLAKALPIKFAEIGIGDRVLARGAAGEDRIARRIVVLPKVEVDKKRERDLEEWRKRKLFSKVAENTARLMSALL